MILLINHIPGFGRSEVVIIYPDGTVNSTSAFTAWPPDVISRCARDTQHKYLAEDAMDWYQGKIDQAGFKPPKDMPWYTLHETNIAMENGPFIDDLSITIVIFHSYGSLPTCSF